MNVTRTILIALLTLVSAQTPQSVATASIYGVVIDASTTMPVSGVTVELTRIEGDKVVSHSELTGEDGTYTFTEIPPGANYELSTFDNGNHLPSAYGQHNPDEPWTPLSLAPGQNMTNVRLLVTPLSSISGRVVDGKGNPLERATVVLLRATYVAGRRNLQAATDFRTNGKGEYTFTGLGTGQYYIRVTPSNDSDFRQLFQSPAEWDNLKSKKKIADPDGYPTTYYNGSSGTRDLTLAKPVDLLNGGKVKGVDVTVAKVKTHRVSGSITSADGQPAPNARVLLVPRATGPESSFTRSVRTAGKPNTPDNGDFDFRGVLPGSYNLIAVMDGVGTPLRTATKPIEVGDSDISKLSVVVARGFDFPGTLQFSDWVAGNPPDYSLLAVNLISGYTTPVDLSLTRYHYTTDPLSVPPTPSGEFTFRNVPPGDYRIVISLNPKITSTTKIPLDLRAAYMTAATLGNTDLLKEGFHVSGKPEGKIQIAIVTDSGSVFGRVLDEHQEPVVPARMVIVPDKARRNRFDLFSPILVSATGRFTLDGIPPGDYKLFAWAHVVDGAWYDPEFMRVYEDQGTAVHIEESGTFPIEISLIH